MENIVAALLLRNVKRETIARALNVTTETVGNWSAEGDESVPADQMYKLKVFRNIVEALAGHPFYLNQVDKALQSQLGSNPLSIVDCMAADQLHIVIEAAEMIRDRKGLIGHPTTGKGRMAS